MAFIRIPVLEKQRQEVPTANQAILIGEVQTNKRPCLKGQGKFLRILSEGCTGTIYIKKKNSRLKGHHCLEIIGLREKKAVVYVLIFLSFLLRNKSRKTKVCFWFCHARH